MIRVHNNVFTEKDVFHDSIFTDGLCSELSIDQFPKVSCDSFEPVVEEVLFYLNRLSSRGKVHHLQGRGQGRRKRRLKEGRGGISSDPFEPDTLTRFLMILSPSIISSKIHFILRCNLNTTPSGETPLSARGNVTRHLGEGTPNKVSLPDQSPRQERAHTQEHGSLHTLDHPHTGIWYLEMSGSMI